MRVARLESYEFCAWRMGKSTSYRAICNLITRNGLEKSKVGQSLLEILC